MNEIIIHARIDCQLLDAHFENISESHSVYFYEYNGGQRYINRRILCQMSFQI